MIFQASNNGVSIIKIVLLVSAQCLIKYFTIVPFPIMQALNNDVSFLQLFALFISAPCSTKYFTIVLFPLLQASNNGVSSKPSILFKFQLNILLLLYFHFYTQ